MEVERGGGRGERSRCFQCLRVFNYCLQELIFKVACGELSAILLLDEILSNTPQVALSVTLSDSAGTLSSAGLTVSVGNDAKGDKESNLAIKELYTPAPSSPPRSAEQKGEIADPGSQSTE
jgi:hypothetical protein